MTNPTHSPPDWVADAIFYQIFPDRFARSPRVPKPGHLQAWGSPPTNYGFQGGDLLGIVEHLDYLQDLGINAIYLNPIFMSASNHRYHTYDYYQVDPLLGGNEALRTLLDAAHARDIRIILDGVFNHASRGFWAFHHILECGAESPYLDWFEIYGFPLHAYESKEKPNYAAWWGLPALPKFNIKNQEVWDFLLGVGEHWIQFGIDGWRLDVPEEITVEGFWEAFRQRVKGANPDAYLVGEIWHLAPEWVKGDRFDGVMNYPLAHTAINFFAADTLRMEFSSNYYPLQPLTGQGALQHLARIFETYSPATQRAHLNILDTHDTPRMLTTAGGDVSALQLAILMQMTLPGAPSIYYGTEIGLEGGRDPDCRRAFQWDTRAWTQALRSWTQQAIRLRKAHPTLRRGTWIPILGEEDVLAYGLLGEGEVIVVVFHTGRSQAQVHIPLEEDRLRGLAQWKDIWHIDINGQSVTWEEIEVTHSGQGEIMHLTLPARHARILLGK